MSGEMYAYLPALHTALAEWLSCLLFIAPRTKRLNGWKLHAVCAAFLGVLLFVNEIRVRQDGILWVLLMLAGMALMLGMMLCCCEARFWKSLYYWAHAFITAEFAASLEWQVNCYLYYEHVLLSDAQMLLVMAVIYTIVLFALGFIHRRSQLMKNQLHTTRQEAVSAALIAFAMFILGNVSFAFRDTVVSRTMGAGVLFVRTMADLCGLVMLYAHDRMRNEMSLRMELSAMDGVLNRQYEQFRLAEANNETMHRVYHDLKHQIAFIRAETDAEKKESYLSELEQVVTRHETEANTGNPVLDTILTSKLQICADYGITLTYFADAAPLEQLNIMDVCSIFGNAIDNAIEYEKTIDDPEQRLIKVTVYTQNHMAMIRVENYCEDTIKLFNGLPRTTKQDEKMHGYGLKSIRSIAEKYGGHLHISQEDNWFSVAILIPMEE